MLLFRHSMKQIIKWNNAHINWAYIFWMSFSQLVLMSFFRFIINQKFPYSGIVAIVIMLIGVVVYFYLQWWCLTQKGRTRTWIFLSMWFALLLIFLSNKKEIKEQPQYISTGGFIKY